MPLLVTPQPSLGEELEWVLEVVSADGHHSPGPDHRHTPGDVVAADGHILVIDPGGAPDSWEDPL